MTTNNYEKGAIDLLFTNSLKLQTTDDFKRFIEFIKRFNHYSRFNTMLIFIQNPDVTFFGSDSFWHKKFNRKVSSTAKPMIILAPMSPVILVYDLFDTKGDQSPEDFLKSGIGQNLFKTQGNIKKGIVQNAILSTLDMNINVILKPMSYFTSGYVENAISKDAIEICIKNNLSNEERLSVLLHELAHLFLGHTGNINLVRKSDNKSFPIKARELPTHIAELEAETVSYLICSKLGLVTSSADYLACYIQSPKDLQAFSFETVIKTADKIENLFIK